MGSGVMRATELTPAECAVLNGLARRELMKEIAAERGWSINTVKTLALRSYRKLAVARIEDAVKRHHRQKNFLGHVCEPVSERPRSVTRKSSGEVTDATDAAALGEGDSPQYLDHRECGNA